MKTITHKLQEDIDQMNQMSEIMNLDTKYVARDEQSYNTIDAKGDIIMTTYAVDKVFETAEDFYNSQDMKDVFGSEYSNVYADRKRDNARWSADGTSTFIKGFKVGHMMIEHYSIKEGLNFIKQIKIGSMLSNAGFDVAIVTDKTISIRPEGYGNTKMNRKILANHTAKYANVEGIDPFTLTTERF